MNNSRNDLPACTQEHFLVSPPTRKGLVEISSFVSIAGTSGRIAIQAQGHILNKLSALPKHRVKDCLYWLIRAYIQERTNEQAPKAIGRNTPLSKDAWRTARVLFPDLVTWSQASQTPSTKSYKKVVRALRSEGFSTINAHRVAAFVIRKNIENLGKPWPGKDPCIDPYKFKQQLEKQEPQWNGYFCPVGGCLAALHSTIGPSKEYLGPSDMPLLVEAVLKGEYLIANAPPKRRIVQTKF